MSSKETNKPLKFLKYLYCGSCNLQFLFRDINTRGPRCPVLLQCGHSVCENCLQQSTKNAKVITCPECNLVTPLESDEHTNNSLSLSFYLLGSLVAYQSHKQERDKQLDFLQKNFGNFNYSSKKQLHSQTDSETSACEECSLPATCFCENCKSNFCDICWSRIHGFAKSLMKHTKIPLSEVEKKKIKLKKCSKHEMQYLEYFCTGCSIAVCQSCVILQHQGKEHNPVTLKEKNLEIMGNVKAVAAEVEVAKKRMTQTLEKINLTQSSKSASDPCVADFENQIVRNFSRLHGILQLQEERCLRQLQEKVNQRDECLKALAKQLELQLEAVESVLKEFQHAVKNPHQADLNDLQTRLKGVENMPCYLISDKSNMEDAKLTFNEKLIELIHSYCIMDLPPSEKFVLCSSADLPNSYTVESLSDTELTEELKTRQKPCTDSSTSDVETISNCSSRDQKQDSKDTEFIPSRIFYEKRKYSVRVTYIKNPWEFYVMLCSQLSKQLAIEKRAAHFATNSVAIPKAVCKDEIFLVKYNVDKKWYRGRVVETLPRQKDSGENVVIYYLDYGNTETVPLSRLRMIPPEMIEVPPLAVKCKLFDCVPKNGKWCVESTKTMEKILNNYAATMYVMRIHQDCLEVDLSVVYPESQIGRDIVSVRDTLLFLDFSSFVNGSKVPQNRVAMEYPEQCLPTVGESFEAIITHINSPLDFYIQRTMTDTTYLLKLTTDLQNYYEENGHKGVIYSPALGMPCAALFSVDQKWYRAKIIDIPGRKLVTVFYVDYGNKETIAWTSIRKLKECFVKRPPLAINCSLAGIQLTDTEWNNGMTACMEKCIFMKDFRVFVQERFTAKQKLKIMLFKCYKDDEISVNKLFHEMSPQSQSKLSPSFVSKILEEDEVDIGNEVMSRVKEKVETEPKIEQPSPEVERPSPEVERPSPEVERPSPDMGNMCKNKRTRNSYPRRTKLSAKKLREMHEYEKKMNAEKPSEEDTEPEGDDYDNIFKVKVDVISAETPSSIYVTFPAMVEEFKIMQTKLNEFYKDSQPNSDKTWATGSICAVYISSKSCWYRASVLELLPDNRVKVFLKDLAQVTNESVTSLRELDSSFTKMATCSVKCHLADVEPAGKQWPDVSSEFLRAELENYEEVYMTKKGQIENKSLPIELWVKRIVPGGALEPTATEWITLNKLLVNQGLAVPSKLQSLYSGVVSQTETSEEVTQILQENTLDDQLNKQPDSNTPEFSPKWSPPEPLPMKRFFAVPSYVDVDAFIYIHTDEDEKELKALKKTFMNKFGEVKCPPNYEKWSPGDLCIARYHIDGFWYRGQILEMMENDTYNVLFVDYGNVEICQSSDLRKATKLDEVPILVHKVQLHDVHPISEDGKWPVSVLEILHSLVVDKRCEVTILKSPKDPNEPPVISMVMVQEDVEVSKFLVNQGLAVRTSKPTSDSTNLKVPIPDNEVQTQDLDKSGSESPPPQYLSLNIPADCEGFFVKITSVTSENEFFANIIDDSSLPPALKNVLTAFEELEEKLLQEGCSQPVLETFATGDPCCCLCPWTNKWCRGEIDSLSLNKENLVCVFNVDDGNKAFVDKDLLHECKAEWLKVPKMAVKFRLSNIERSPNAKKSTYKKGLNDCLKKAKAFAQIVKNEDIVEVKLLTEDKQTLLYQGMIGEKLMKFKE